MPDEIAPTTPAAAPAVETPAAPTPDSTPKESAAPTLEEAMASLDVSKMTDAQMADLESGDTERVRSALGLTNDKPADKAPTAQAPQAQAAPEGTPSLTDKPAARVSLKSLPPETASKLIQVINMARDGSMTFEQAQAKVFGVPAATPAPTAAPTSPAPAAEPEPPPPSPAAIKVEELTTKVADLKAKYDAAKKVFSPDADAIFEEYLEAKADVKEAQREAVAYEAKAKEWNAAQAASQERATLKFSDLITDPESNFLELCTDEIALAEMKNDPILNSPDWPEKIGERVKGKFFKGYDANSAAAGDDEPTTIPPAPNQRVRLPGSPVGPGFAAGAMSPQTALSEFDKLTPEQQEALILEVNKLPAPRR